MSQPIVPKVERMPTPEHCRHLGANACIRAEGTRDEGYGIRYRNLYELVADPAKDMLKESYGDCFSRLVSAKYAFGWATGGNAGRASDTPGQGDPNSMPQADFYLAIQKRFHEHRAHMMQQGSRVDHWGTIEMLMCEIPAGFDEAQIEGYRAALAKSVHKIEAALDLLSEWSEAISKSYRDRIDAEKSIASGVKGA